MWPYFTKLFKRFRKKKKMNSVFFYNTTYNDHMLDLNYTFNLLDRFMYMDDDIKKYVCTFESRWRNMSVLTENEHVWVRFHYKIERNIIKGFESLQNEKK